MIESLETSMTARQLRDLSPTEPRPHLFMLPGGKWSCSSTDDDECIGATFKGAYARWRMTRWKAQISNERTRQ